MYYNKFTILIPTRERADTLEYTIRCCLNQTYQDLEIIVSDNFSQDNTYHIVKSFNDKRLKYINTGKRVSMSENFDFALSHVVDGYVMFIGDDDGILPNSLEYVNEIIYHTKCEAVVSHNAFYTWPGTKNPNQLTWSSSEGYEIRQAKEWIRKYLNFNMLYTFDLPGAYCGFVKRTVFDRVTINGRFFRSSTPDAYSALAVAFSIDYYVFSYTPFAVHGSSARSNGGAYLSTGNQKEGEESKLFFKENTIPVHPGIVMTKAFRVCSLETYLQFSDAFPELTKEYKIDWEIFLRYVMTERSEATKDEIENAVKKMCVMYNVDYDRLSSSIPKKFTGVSYKEIVFRAITKIKNTIKNKKSSVADATRYGIYNVYDAVLLLNFFLKEN